MLFSSFTFLFAFLPLVIVVYYLGRSKTYKNLVLLVFSLVFYAWGEPIFVLIMIIMIIVNYLIGLLFDTNISRKMILWVAIILNLGVLGYFKYSNFFIENINNLVDTDFSMVQVVLPIGISFYTFQILSYIIDLYYKRLIVQKNILDFACYVALFPQLIAGPIVRYIDIQSQLTEREESLGKLQTGLRRFVFGLGKKVIISNNVAIVASDIFALSNEELTFSVAWLGALAYTLQIYFDFSGYSDMAIGLGKVFGFKFLENFNYPYISKSITDFWRRWHISMSTWFRDYVYFPLGGSRVSKGRMVLNLLTVWALTGLWHGAAWNFIVWGLYFFVIILLERLFISKVIEKLPIINHVYSLLLIVLGWVIFNSSSFEQIQAFFSVMLSFEWFDFSLFEQLEYVYLIPYFVIGVIFSLPIYPGLKKMFKKNQLFEISIDLFSVIVLLASILFLINNTYNPFIYFRF